MADDEFTCDLFRFLQLLCEGHNNGGSRICMYSKMQWTWKNVLWFIAVCFKGLVHPKMTILALITRPNVVPNAQIRELSGPA